MNHEENTIRQRVAQAIEDVRPSLQADGGDIELIDVADDGTVTVRLQGACNGCPMAKLTLSHGVEVHLKKVVPEVTSVVAD